VVVGLAVGFFAPPFYPAAGRFPLWLKVFLHTSLGAYLGLLVGCLVVHSGSVAKGECSA
jgi:hypothetical protein